MEKSFINIFYLMQSAYKNVKILALTKYIYFDVYQYNEEPLLNILSNALAV